MMAVAGGILLVLAVLAVGPAVLAGTWKVISWYAFKGGFFFLVFAAVLVQVVIDIVSVVQ